MANKQSELRSRIVCNFPEFYDAEVVLRAESFLSSLKNPSSQSGVVNIQPVNIAPHAPRRTENESWRQVRQQIAEVWLNTSADKLAEVYLSEVGNRHQTLLNSGVKNQPLTETEQTFVANLAESIAKGFDAPNAIQYILAAQLYRYAYQLPLKYENAPIPKWFFKEFMKFILEAPSCFREIGESDKYYQYIQKVVEYININMRFGNPKSEIWRQVGLLFTQNANFTPLYFTQANLKEIYTKRTEIIELTLKSLGCEIDYVFPQASPRTKIRLGVLQEDFGNEKDTIVTLPAYEYLDRDFFEIILYAVKVSGDRLEKYCQSRADKLIKLPEELEAQVGAIRSDDLDILLIGTPTTGITNAIALLALHRLARVQLTGASSPVTTGMRHVDYYIAGNLTSSSPPFFKSGAGGGSSSQQHHREQLVIIPGSGICFSSPLEPEIPTIEPERISWGALSESVVFMSGANFCKILPELQEAWAKIIARVPNSLLVLYPFGPYWNQALNVNDFYDLMQVIFAKHGIDRRQLVMVHKLPRRADVKACLELADVYLDAYPYTGVHSLLDALEVGLPTVVREGNALRSKRAAAMLRELEVPELIAESEEDYIKLAVALGTHPELRRIRREQLQQKFSGSVRFLDSRAYAAQMGALFQQLCRGKLDRAIPR